ncbi:hypothetical protein FIU87_03600 [Bacillus sp. THAF10]|uniref:hypothetical protein n=1 Tax=Bacillus sp. THAF10 TaxID=2587848 RepID=UPI001267AC74|nr:hypothetical protein [Bacillus sp. THAF10]QFT87728.1 hypothetical protein FIU87_03600 [Bacillus sp. THAF10]
MKKTLSLMLLLLVLGITTACGDKEVQEKEVKDVVSANEEASNASEEQMAEETKETDTFKKEINTVIVDNETIKATLISVEKIVDTDWDEEKVEVKFEVENKREDTIEVQAREVSADDKMIDDMMLSMSTEISSGKRADAILTIQNYEGDLPVIEENIEMLLHVFSWDDMDFEEQHPVLIEFK